MLALINVLTSAVEFLAPIVITTWNASVGFLAFLIIRVVGLGGVCVLAHNVSVYHILSKLLFIIIWLMTFCVTFIQMLKWSVYNTKICAQLVLLFLCFGLFLRLLVAMVTSPVMASWTFSHSSFKSVPSEGWEVRGCREERRRVGSKRGDSCVWGCGYEEVVSVIHEDGLKTWMSWFTSSLLLSVTTNLSTIFSSGFRSLAGLSSSKQAESSVAQWDWSWGTTLGRWLHST